MKKKKVAVVSVSGGMDSTGLLLKLIASGKYYAIHILNFFYGQKHRLEMTRLNQNIQYLQGRELVPLLVYKKIDLSNVMKTFSSALTEKGGIDVPEGHYAQSNMKLTIVPNRNAIFSSITYGYALSAANKTKSKVDIALGVHSGDHFIYPDCRPEFYKELQYAFKIGNIGSSRVKWILPFMNGNKTTILKSIQKSCNILDIDFNAILRNTNTCYKPNNKGNACGKCGSCTERLEAFSNIKRIDPVPYQ